MSRRHLPLIGALMLVAGAAWLAQARSQVAHAASAVSVFAEGLNNPRGLKFGPDGGLYVAEGGKGGLIASSDGNCEQVVPPVGPYTGDMTGRISRIDATGVRSTVIEGLPSSQTSPALGNLVSGVGDVEFIGDTLYALLAGAGCSHGLDGTVNGIIRVHDGTWDLVADLSAWQKAHPVANPEEDDFEPDGTWYSMVAVRGDLYAVEPNHGEMVRVTPAGEISRVIDVSATQGHVVPTSVTYRGNFFLGNLNTFPITEGSSNVYKVTPSGEIKVWASGFTNVVGVAFDRRSRMYVLEGTVGHPMPTPGSGRVVRVEPSGRRTVIADGLSVPTAMTFGPDGNLYVSNVGYGAPPIGLGQVVKIAVN